MIVPENIDIPQILTPSAISGNVSLYPKADNLLYPLNDIGIEKTLCPLITRLTMDVPVPLSGPSGTAQNVTGFSFPIAANETWKFFFNLIVKIDTTAAAIASVSVAQVGITVPQGSTLRAIVTGQAFTAATIGSDILTSSGQLAGVDTNRYIKQNGNGVNTGWIQIAGKVVSSAAGGAVQLQVAESTGAAPIGTVVVTVLANSFLRAYKLN